MHDCIVAEIPFSHARSLFQFISGILFQLIHMIQQDPEQHEGPAKRDRATEGRCDRALMQGYRVKRCISNRSAFSRARSHGKFNRMRGVPQRCQAEPDLLQVNEAFPGFARVTLLRFGDAVG